MIALSLLGLFAMLAQIMALFLAFASGREHEKNDRKAANIFLQSALVFHAVTFGLVSIAFSLAVL